MLCTTWLICPRSTCAGQRLSAKSKSPRTREPCSANPTASRTMSGSSTALRTGDPPFANVSNCCVRSRARNPARSLSTRKFSSSACSCRPVSTSEILPRITVNKLLKSCAIPPASTPSDSSRADRASSASSRVAFSSCSRICAVCFCTRRRSANTHAKHHRLMPPSDPTSRAMRLAVHHVACRRITMSAGERSRSRNPRGREIWSSCSAYRPVSRTSLPIASLAGSSSFLAPSNASNTAPCARHTIRAPAEESAISTTCPSMWTRRPSSSSFNLPGASSGVDSGSVPCPVFRYTASRTTRRSPCRPGKPTASTRSPGNTSSPSRADTRRLCPPSSM